MVNKFGFTDDEDAMDDFLRYHPPPEKDTQPTVTAITKTQGKKIIELLELLVRASETELVQLRFDTGKKTLTTAVANVPSDSDVSATGYTREVVRDILNRTSPELYVCNHGPGTIFLRTSRNGKSFSQTESCICEGEIKTFYDVYEIRLRSPTANTEYIITEFEYVKNKDIVFYAGRPYVAEQTLGAGGTRTEDIINGTAPAAGLGRNAHTGYIINDGAGNITIELSNDGTNYTTPVITVIPNEILDLDGEDMNRIRITSAAGAAYRLAVH